MEAQAAASVQPLSEEQQSPIPEETKSDRFVRLGEKRMDKALKVIEQIGNLANRASYDYQPEDVEAISSALHAALDEAMARFRPRGQRVGFKLRGE